MSVAGDSEPTREAASGNALGRIGPYHLLQPLGHGGMGEVWIAEQREPVWRRVAVKVIKLGMDTRQVVARFEAERQALAVMDHPAIAKVLDAGTTDAGRPYFVMEYVKGEPITDYCDRHRLPVADRLALFVRVCEGVQHAHQKGIIHRDLKPTNILVTVQDEQPVPKIIDFGIAKATAHHFAAETVFTELGAMVGTPEYMSPEQAEMGGLDIDTRTDVYSLGVLLYELLSGTLPFGSDQLRAKALDEIRRTIREVDPPKLSTRVTLADAASSHIAQSRQTEPARLASELRGDLEWITMRAMEKDRTRRYDTAMGLANDIRRHLGNEPVSAGPPSAVYRARKFARRHRFGVATAAVFVLLLVAFGATMTVQARRIALERDRANREAETARQVSDFLVSLFRVSDPSQSRGESVTAREVLDQGAARLERELGRQPLQRARLLNTIGSVYSNLGLYKKAGAALNEALAVRRKALGDADPQVAANLRDIGELYRRQGDYADAERVLRQAMALSERRLASDPLEVADTAHLLGVLYDSEGKSREAEAQARRSLQIREKALGAEGPAVARSLNSLAAILWNAGRVSEAEPLLRRALTIKEKTLGPNDPEIATTLNNLAVLYKGQGKYREAEPLFTRANAIVEKVYGSEHPEYGDSLNNLAAFYEEQKRYAEAEACYLKALAIWEKAVGPDKSDVAVVLHNLGNLYRNQGRYADAEGFYVRSQGIWERTIGPDHPYLAIGYREQAVLYGRMGRHADAEALFKKAIAIQEKHQGADPLQLAESLDAYAAMLRQAGRDREAARFASRAKEIRDRNPG